MYWAGSSLTTAWPCHHQAGGTIDIGNEIAECQGCRFLLICESMRHMQNSLVFVSIVGLGL